jgi:hypothetical protein
MFKKRLCFSFSDTQWFFSTDLKYEYLCDNDNNLIKYSFLSESINLKKKKKPIK